MEYLEGCYSATIFQGVGVQGGGVHDFVKKVNRLVRVVDC